MRDTLKKNAGDQAMFLGHWLEDWADHGPSRSVTYCRHCLMGIAINSNPEPTELQIGGGAHVHPCRKETPATAPELLAVLSECAKQLSAMGATGHATRAREAIARATA